MASLLSPSFFIRDINIPNTGTPAILNNLTSYINRYEPECLVNLFGYPLYKLFLADGFVSSRMIDLRDGSEYIDAFGNLKKFEGLVHDTNSSLIAFYVYYLFQEANATLTTGVSTKVSDSEGGKSVSPIEKMVYAWNQFSKGANILVDFLWYKVDVNGVRVYSEFDNEQYWKSKDFCEGINLFGL